MTKEEFGHISDGMRRDLIALARRFLRATGGPEEAEDIVQEALLALWELSEKGYPIRSEKALAIKITKNICISRYRKRRIETVSIQDDSISGGFSAEERTEAADNTRIKKSVYGELNKSEAELMTMKAENGLTLDEIAKETGRPKQSIKVTISNARRKLREQMKKL
jgi:RNA polymerase sigma-70 factor (ECF subfamily)